jgi:hypothetical protein
MKLVITYLTFPIYTSRKYVERQVLLYGSSSAFLTEPTP